jgi:hypothetical protein
MDVVHRIVGTSCAVRTDAKAFVPHFRWRQNAYGNCVGGIPHYSPGIVGCHWLQYVHSKYVTGMATSI